MNTGFALDADATASAVFRADRSMTEPDEHGAGWRMLTAFASDAADATACAASGSDRSMTEPEERAGWPMHTGFAGNVDATACAASGARMCILFSIPVPARPHFL
jgi:hypothetical protein